MAELIEKNRHLINNTDNYLNNFIVMRPGLDGEVIPQNMIMRGALKEHHFPLLPLPIIPMDIENAPAVGALLKGHKPKLVPGTKEDLVEFMVREPQKDIRGSLRYLVTSGLAVEVITGKLRYHYDVDLVIFDNRTEWWKKYLIDKVVAQRYWAEMKFDPAYLEDTAWEARFMVENQECTVLTVHPAIILTQKLSDVWGKVPRDKDLEDVQSLVQFWKDQERGSQRWINIIAAAILALPESEQSRTQSRIDPYIEEISRFIF